MQRLVRAVASRPTGGVDGWPRSAALRAQDPASCRVGMRARRMGRCQALGIEARRGARRAARRVARRAAMTGDPPGARPADSWPPCCSAVHLLSASVVVRLVLKEHLQNLRGW